MMPTERVVLMLHRHWIIGARIFIQYGLIAVVFIAAWVALRSFTTALTDPTSIAYALIVLALSTAFLIWGLFFFIAWLDFYLDTWIVSNERIINIRQKHLFDRVVSEQKLFRVQDVTSEIKGPFAGMFGFGNVIIQTAGEQEEFRFEQVPHPAKVAQTIMSLLESIEHQIGLDKVAKVEGDMGEVQTTQPSAPPPAGALPPKSKEL